MPSNALRKRVTTDALSAPMPRLCVSNLARTASSERSGSPNTRLLVFPSASNTRQWLTPMMKLK